MSDFNPNIEMNYEDFYKLHRLCECLFKRVRHKRTGDFIHSEGYFPPNKDGTYDFFGMDVKRLAMPDDIVEIETIDLVELTDWLHFIMEIK